MKVLESTFIQEKQMIVTEKNPATELLKDDS